MARGNPENLRAAAQRKSQATIKRAETALRTMIKNGEPITFRGVARTAGCSIDFLYGNPELRRRIEHLRTQQQKQPAPARATVERRQQQRHPRADRPARRAAPPPPRRGRRTPRGARGRARREPRTATAPRSAKQLTGSADASADDVGPPRARRPATDRARLRPGRQLLLLAAVAARRALSGGSKG